MQGDRDRHQGVVGKLGPGSRIGGSTPSDFAAYWEREFRPRITHGGRRGLGGHRGGIRVRREPGQRSLPGRVMPGANHGSMRAVLWS